MALSADPSAPEIPQAKPLLGILLKVLATLAFTLMAILGRSLAGEIPVGEMVFFRASFAFLPLGAWMVIRGVSLHTLRTRHPLLHARRAATGVLAMFTYFSALMFLPVADLTAIGFASPLIVVVLAATLLGERVGAYRWSAVAAGFVGVTIMLLPHLSGEVQSGWGVMLALANAIFVAFTMIFIRSMSQSEPPLTIAFFFQLSCALISGITLAFDWVTPRLDQFAILAGIGILGGIGQLLMTTSYRHAAASTLANFDYAAMIWAVLLGWMFFAEVPVAEVFIGAVVVVGSGLFIVWRERQLGRQAAPADRSH